MGSEDFYPEERPVAPRQRRRVLDGRAPGHRGRVPALREATTGYVTRRRAAARRRPTTRTPTRRCSSPARSSSADARARSTSTTSGTGGTYVPGAYWKRPGGPGSTSTAATGTRSCTSPARTPRRTPRGPARSCRPRPSGSTPPAAASTARPSPGATSTSRTGRPMANTWQGEFPWQNLKLDGYEGTSPVGSVPAQRLRPLRHGRQRLGVDDATSTRRRTRTRSRSPCCVAAQPAGDVARAATTSASRANSSRARVIKGGSHLCAPNYCLRYRPAARQGETSTRRRPTSASAASCANPVLPARRRLPTRRGPRRGTRGAVRSRAPRRAPGRRSRHRA